MALVDPAQKALLAVESKYADPIVLSLAPLTIQMPYPPTVNTYWRTAVIKNHAVTYISENGKAYKKAVATLKFKRFKLWTCNVALDILIDAPDERVRDLDNLPKCLFDSLTGILWKDDHQVKDFRIRWSGNVSKKGVILKIDKHMLDGQLFE